LRLIGPFQFVAFILLLLYFQFQRLVINGLTIHLVLTFVSFTFPPQVTSYALMPVPVVSMLQLELPCASFLPLPLTLLLFEDHLIQ